jgi:hypothetical protein
MRVLAIGVALASACWALSTAAAAARSPQATAAAKPKLVPRAIGEVPPANPKHSLALDEHLRPDCSGVHDVAPTCVDESVAMLNAGRRDEHLGPLLLPSNWSRLTVAQQLFVMTDLERTARGLAPDTGLATDWDAAAAAGAQTGRDPTGDGSGAHGFASVWAGGEANPVVTMVGWIYDDALFPDGSSSNIDCSADATAGCWGHRDAVLHDTAASSCGRRCAIGAGYSPDGFAGAGSGSAHESYAEVFGIGGANNPDPLVFRWTSELQYLPACEHAGDSCGWSGRPLVSASGFLNIRGVAPGASAPVSPWFPVAVHLETNSSGEISVSVAVRASVTTVDVTARRGSDDVTLRVRQLSSDNFVASGRLSAGRWTVTILYRIASDHGPSPSTIVPVNVPGG